MASTLDDRGQWDFGEGLLVYPPVSRLVLHSSWHITSRE